MAPTWKDPELAKSFEQLREIVSEDEFGIDVLCAQFLISSKHDVAQAVEGLRKAIEWRKEAGIEEIRQAILTNNLSPKDFPGHTELVTAIPTCNGGPAIDRRGLPYGIRCLGQADFDLFNTDGYFDILLQNHLYTVEWRTIHLQQYAEETGEVAELLSVQDLQITCSGNEWVRQAMPTLPRLKTQSKIVHEYYPGQLGAIYITNPPWGFGAVWAWVRPVLPGRIQDRIDIVAHGDLTRLQTSIAPANLPKFLGGDVADADFVDRTLNYDHLPELLEMDAGDVQEIEKEVGVGRAVIWTFHVESLDVNFSLTFEPLDAGDDEDEVECIPQKQVSGFNFGVYEPPSAGTVKMKFDNSYSWIKSKTIRWQMELRSEEELGSGLQHPDLDDDET